MLAFHRVLIFSLFSSLLFSACGGSQNGLTDINPDQDITIDPGNPPVTGNWYKPAINTNWQWQLKGTVNTNYNVELYDIDLFNAAGKIAELHAQGKKIICYFSAGSSENWRPDFQNFNASDLGNPLDGWDGERWLDIRSDNVRNIMISRLQLAQQQGCDGVEPDNVDGYENNPGFNFTADDQLNYNRFIANQARLLGLSVGLKNDLSQIGALVEYYDFAVNEQCFQYNECDVYKLFTDRNKPVFNAEYYVADPNSLCQKALSHSFRTLILPLNLDDTSRISCDP